MNFIWHLDLFRIPRQTDKNSRVHKVYEITLWTIASLLLWYSFITPFSMQKRNEICYLPHLFFVEGTTPYTISHLENLIQRRTLSNIILHANLEKLRGASQVFKPYTLTWEPMGKTTMPLHLLNTKSKMLKWKENTPLIFLRAFPDYYAIYQRWALVQRKILSHHT